jgi:hypothetical protein
MPFDPKQYAAGGLGAGGFNPEVYAAGSVSAAPEKAILDRGGPAQTALESAADTAMLGYLPHAQAGLSKLIDPSISYTAERDSNIKRLAVQRAENPKSAMLGTGLGVGASLLLPAGAIAKGAGVAGKLAQGAKMGAIYGGLANPGDTEGDISPLQLEARGKNAAVGAGLGAGTAGLAELIGAGASKASGYLKGKAEEKAVKSFGGNAEYRKLHEKGLVNQLGRSALDEGVVTPFSTPSRLEGRAETLKEKAGERVGRILDEADAKQMFDAPAGYERAGKTRTVKPEVQMTPVEIGLRKSGKMVETYPEVYVSPVKEVVKAGKGRAVEILPEMDVVTEPGARVTSVLSGPEAAAAHPKFSHATGYLPGKTAKQGAITADVYEPLTTKIVRDGKTEKIREAVKYQPVEPVVKKAGGAQVIEPAIQYDPIRPTYNNRVDAEELAKSVRAMPEIREIYRTPGMETLASSVDKMLETLKGRGNSLTLREAQALRQSIDKSINFSKKSDQLRGNQEVLYKIRTAVRNKMNDVVNSLGGEQDALLSANRRYGALQDLEELAGKQSARDSTNRAISLTDTIAGAAGVASGGTPGVKAGLGLGLTAANKLGRTFGNSLMATGFDAASKRLARVPALAAMATNNPTRFQAVVAMIKGGGPFKESERDPIEDPAIQEIFLKNPGLLGEIKDEKRRAAIKARLMRTPGSAIERKFKGQ